MKNRVLVESSLLICLFQLSSFALAMPVAQLQVRTNNFVSRVCCYDYEIRRADAGCTAHKDDPAWGIDLPKEKSRALPKIEIPRDCVVSVEGNQAVIKRECMSNIKVYDEQDLPDQMGYRRLMHSLDLESSEKPEVTLIINDPC